MFCEKDVSATLSKKALRPFFLQQGTNPVLRHLECQESLRVLHNEFQSLMIMVREVFQNYTIAWRHFLRQNMFFKYSWIRSQ